MTVETKSGESGQESKGFLPSAVLLIRSRLEPISGWTWNTAAASFIAGRGSPPLMPSVLVAVSMVFISLSVYIYNDIIEANMDKLNAVKRCRPLPSGKVSLKNALILVYLSGFCGLTILFFTNFYSFIFGLTYFCLLIAYSHPKIRIKKRFPLKESVLALCFPLTSLIGMYAVTNSFVIHAFFAGVVIALFVYTIEPVITDSTDIEEDKLTGVKTLASTLSWERRTYLFAAGPFMAMVLILLMYKALGFNGILPVLTVTGGVIFLLFTSSVLKKYSEAAVVKARNTAHIYFILLQISFIIGSINGDSALL